MKLTLSGTVVHLKGNWTLGGVTQNALHALADSLELLGSRPEKNPKIDCKQIIKFDQSGQQILYTWLQCLKIRGIEPVLTNLPGTLQNAFQRLGFQCCF